MEDADGDEALADAHDEEPAAAAQPKRQVRGRYRGTTVGWQLELRVDVDGPRPMDRVSGDFFSTSGSTTSYFGSFIVEGASIVTTASEVRIEGLARFSWDAGAPLVRVTIPRVSAGQARQPATIQFLTPPSTLRATYLCAFGSRQFRTVQWEQDSVAGTVPFVSYDTGSLPAARRQPGAHPHGARRPSARRASRCRRAGRRT